jgi:hypothetical protein
MSLFVSATRCLSRRGLARLPGARRFSHETTAGTGRKRPVTTAIATVPLPANTLAVTAKNDVDLMMLRPLTTDESTAFVGVLNARAQKIAAETGRTKAGAFTVRYMGAAATLLMVVGAFHLTYSSIKSEVRDSLQHGRDMEKMRLKTTLDIEKAKHKMLPPKKEVMSDTFN